MGKAIIPISLDLLMQILKLDGCKVIDLRYNGFRVGGTIDICVWHDLLPEGEPHSMLPVAWPLYRQAENGEVTLEQVDVRNANGDILLSFNLNNPATCRVCGCTDDHACPGGCYWVKPDLCSRCAEEMELDAAR